MEPFPRTQRVGLRPGYRTTFISEQLVALWQVSLRHNGVPKEARMKDEILKDLPRMPLEVVEQWLVPFAEDEGWPPENERWTRLLFVTDLKYWREVTWTLEEVELQDIPFTAQALQQLNGLYEAYVLGEDNDYAKHLGEGGQQRFRFHKEYLEKHRTLSCPPILADHAWGSYDIMDGNHRLLAYCEAAKQMDIPPQKIWIGVSEINPAPYLG